AAALVGGLLRRLPGGRGTLLSRALRPRLGTLDRASLLARVAAGPRDTVRRFLTLRLRSRRGAIAGRVAGAPRRRSLTRDRRGRRRRRGPLAGVAARRRPLDRLARRRGLLARRDRPRRVAIGRRIRNRARRAIRSGAIRNLSLDDRAGCRGGLLRG